MGPFLLSPLDEATAPLILDAERGFAMQQFRRQAQHRTLHGAYYAYPWHRVQRFRVPLSFVESATAARINGWWQAGTVVAFTLDSSAWPSTHLCRAVNAETPLHTQREPYAALRAGELLLENLLPGDAVPRPFILDDPVLGRLDQPYNAVL